MKKRVAALVMCLALTATAVFPASAAAAEKTDDIVILYENDVHCAVEGYSKLAAMKKELEQIHDYVGVVSSGDYIQGTGLGAISKGESIVRLMNLVGYDAVTVGNHEFDYRLPRLMELVGMMETKPVCCNFRKIGEENSWFEPYSMVTYGDTQVAYIGIITPATPTSTVPAQFKNEQGAFLYTFHAEDLYDVVQANIDSARAAGADYIVALSHMGDQEEMYDIVELIENTEGFDVVLDAHSHSVIESSTLLNQAGNAVILSSTGTKFEHIGKLTLSDDGIKTELIRTEDYQKTDPTVDAYIQTISDEFAVIGERKIAVSEVDLITHDEADERIIRTAETNLGNLCADAFRFVTEADIAYVNGGGIRSDLKCGDVTFNDLMDAFPFHKQTVVAEISGQVLKDLLEKAVMSWPGEHGAFPHMSGVTFAVDPGLASSVTVDGNGAFTGVAGAYRVYDIRVLNGESGSYEPLDPEKTYSIASQDYFILEYGDGMNMFEDAQNARYVGALDIEVLETYITEHLGGVIGQEYARPQGRIRFEERPAEEQSAEKTGKAVIHTVQWGDTLWALSRKYGCTVQNIWEWNRGLIKDPDWIYVGWELNIETK